MANIRNYSNKIFFLFILLFIASCSPVDQPDIDVKDNQTVIGLDQTNNTTSDLNFPSWLEKCDRFRDLFQNELNKYPELKEYFDLAMIYSLVYQESLCQTPEEMRLMFIERNITDQGWKGGIMQVDACWRWGAPYNCTTPEQQIFYGMRELNSSLAKIKTDSLEPRQQLTLLFLAYNRGYYVSTDAIGIYNHKLINNTFLIDGLTKLEDNRFYVYVNCTEKDVCMNDYEHLDITEELGNFSTDFDRSLLIACRSKYGYMHNFQGDYCTGPGYGLMYPVSIFDIYEKIVDYRN